MWILQVRYYSNEKDEEEIELDIDDGRNVSDVDYYNGNTKTFHDPAITLIFEYTPDATNPHSFVWSCSAYSLTVSIRGHNNPKTYDTKGETHLRAIAGINTDAVMNCPPTSKRALNEMYYPAGTQDSHHLDVNLNGIILQCCGAKVSVRLRPVIALESK
ncbi:5211_t:CDS:2 [Paraglomus occultum]|uniref:5211_t:CDS:1 n=1 Tax=Paraglomus occultum TaxID=144539 RepID=A0A9N9AT31_9GLOM|nr:5211_t:CDS:2 [Paraglomus occultum]